MACGCKKRLARVKDVFEAIWEKFPYSFSTIPDADRLLADLRRSRANAPTVEMPVIPKSLESPIVTAERRDRFAVTRKRDSGVTK
jgi:hypothetical protein